MANAAALNVKVHPTALIEAGVEMGSRTAVWDNVHIRAGAKIGSDCIIGEKSYIAYGVRVGSFVKINAFVYICAGVTIEDFVMISAGTVFTNDKFPRAFLPDMKGLAPSSPTEEILPTLVKKGAAIGANATIGCGIEIGQFAMVGMGSVVTQSVPDFHLVYGIPARHKGYVCQCGVILGNERSFSNRDERYSLSCKRCNRNYPRKNGQVFQQ